MTLIKAILRKVHSKESIDKKKYTSPPPELENIERQRKKKTDPYAHVKSRVDSSAPKYHSQFLYRLQRYKQALDKIILENMQLVMSIQRAHLMRGRVDCRWGHEQLPPPVTQYGERRVQFYRRVHRDNLLLHQLISSAPARVATTAEHRRAWRRNKQVILQRAQAKFVLFPPVPSEDIEDPAFASEGAFKRPRVELKLRFRGGAVLGKLIVELFTDVCPLTCGLFTDLVDGDGLGHGYVGTCFFRKVPDLFWSGGDVIYNNGFGCYAQKGRALPIGAENYHFSHSMPGLVSMRMTRDNEMCASFNITFKPLPQFDLKNVVFGRIVRPSATYDAIRSLGHPLSSKPVVEICATRRRDGDRWLHGQENTKIIEPILARF